MISQATYVPDFSLRLNGRVIPEALRASIISVRLEEGIPSMTNQDCKGSNAADRVEIEIANDGLRWVKQHIKGLGFKPFPTAIKVGPVRAAALSEGLFDLDNKLELSLGYQPARMVDVFEGEVTGVKASFPGRGMPVLRLIAHSYLNRLTQGSYARGFGPLPDALIAAILSAENLLLPLIDPVVMGASTAMAVLNTLFNRAGKKQTGQTNYELLKEIADTYDADFWVDGNTLVLSRLIGKEQSPSTHLRWGESLISLSPEVTTIGQVAAVGAKFTLPMLPKLDFFVTVGWDFDREAVRINVIPGVAAAATPSLLGSVVGTVKSLIDNKLTNPVDITSSALALTRMLRSVVNSRVTAGGRAVGNPQLRAGSLVRIEGVGPDFSGDYRIISATHSFDSGGYFTDFQSRRELIP
jgi:phage protein D